jgi:DNA-binding protein YbaB
MTLPGSEDDAGARVDQWVAAAKAKARRYQVMQAQVEQVSVTESSTDNIVTVTVESSGNVTNLVITDRVREMSGAQIAAMVLETMRRAQAKLPVRLGEVMAEAIGDDTSTIDKIVGNYRAKFPEPAESSVTREVTRNIRLGQPEDDEDDGWADQPFRR